VRDLTSLGRERDLRDLDRRVRDLTSLDLDFGRPLDVDCDRPLLLRLLDVRLAICLVRIYQIRPSHRVDNHSFVVDR